MTALTKEQVPLYVPFGYSMGEGQQQDFISVEAQKDAEPKKKAVGVY